MFKLLFKMMEKRTFISINEFFYENNNYDLKKKKEFFNFYNKFKPLFGRNKLYIKKDLISLFWKEINKITFKEKKKIINKNPFIVYFLNDKEFDEYFLHESKKDRNWWMFESTFNKRFKDLDINILNKNPSLCEAGRFMLLNKNVKIQSIKKILNNLFLIDLFNLDGTYLSWDEFLSLIEKVKFNPKEYLINLAKKTDFFGTRKIIDGIFNMNSNISHKLKKDKKFKENLYTLEEKQFKTNPDIKEFKFEHKINTQEIIEWFKKNLNIYVFFELPKESKEKSIFLSNINDQSLDINYDTTQVDGNYLYMFMQKITLLFNIYQKYLEWVLNNKKKIFIYVNKEKDKNLLMMNDLILRWIKEKDLEISGFIALKFLKESILLLIPDKKEEFQKKSFYEIVKEVAKKFKKNNIIWTTEILFAPTDIFLEARNKICHFNINDFKINFAIMCLGMEFFNIWRKMKLKL